MIAYPDASLVVAALTGEVGSSKADAWLSEYLADLAVSGWLNLEVASGLAAKARNEDISAEQHRAARDFYARAAETAVQKLQITSKTFANATLMIELAAGLRAGDALHLAIAEAHQATLFTLDVRQAEAGRKIGVPTVLV